MVTEISIQLLDEGTEVYRPTLGEEIEPGIYRVLPTEDYDPEDEVWEFLPGTIVRCMEETKLGDYGRPMQVLVARQKIG